MKSLKNLQKGFTIVELMIATSVLSVILLLVSVMMLSIGNLFYKGVNQARVQDNVRSITDDVSQHLKLVGASSITPFTGTYFNGGNRYDVSGYCIGSTRYTAIIGHQVGNGPEPNNPTIFRAAHVLWRDTTPVCGPLDISQANPLGSGSDGTELIAPGSRLTEFCIGSLALSCTNDVTSPYTLTVSVAFGESDLLSSTPYSITTTCNGSTGDQYCATAGLSTLVTQRL